MFRLCLSRPAHTPGWGAALAVSLLLGCKTALPPAPPPPPPEPAVVIEDPGNEMVRQRLRVAPLEATFSGVRGEASDDIFVGIKNVSRQPVQIAVVRIVGPDAATFSLLKPPALPRYLAPDKQMDLSIGFAPTADTRVGVHRATLQMLTGPREEHGPPVDISALVLAGQEGESEPPLQQVVQALGYKINVGGESLMLGTDAAPLGEEISAGLFKSIRPGNIALDPVARFSLDGALPYGFYRPGDGGALQETQLAVLGQGNHQRLNPGFEDGEGQIAFDPGSEPFGIFARGETHTTYTENARNQERTPEIHKGKGKPKAAAPSPATVQHAVRVFPLRSRNGTPVPDAYLIAFEEAANGDYQDYVFVLWNVTPVSPGAPP